jgi:serine/threonine protein kinase
MGLADWFAGLFKGSKDKKKASGKPVVAIPKPALKKKTNPFDGLVKIDGDKRFEKIARTGQGSMSKVWRALDRKTGRQVCLKVLDKEKTLRFEARFQGLNKPFEGEISLGLKHPNIMQTFEYGLFKDGDPYIVMELVDGVGLNFLVETRSKKLEGNRLNYICQICDAIEYLHNSGYLHRDICPRNIMVSNEGEIKLIDFGLAIPYRPEFCRPGNRTGTPNYLAPEIIRRSSTDHRVDMFALGVTAYELFCHDMPWESAQSMQTLIGHINSPPKNPKELCPDMPDEIEKFLLKAIAKEPRDRFQNPAEMREAAKRLTEK